MNHLFKQDNTVWARITLVFVTLEHFKKKAKEYGVEVLEIQSLGGILFRRYRVRLKGSQVALRRLSQY